MGLFSRLIGTVSPFFQLGGPTGPRLKNNAGSVEAKDSGDATYINVRGGDPVIANDLVTLEYLQAKYVSYLLVAQAAHGFSTGQAIYFTTGGVWSLARANSGSTLGIGIAVVVDVNDFYVYLLGPISGLSGLTVGNYYYVSDATPGALTLTEPTSTSSFSNPILFAVTSTTALVLPFRPSSLAGNLGPTWNITVQNSAYGANVGDFVLASTSIAPFTVTLPTAVGITGKTIAVKKTSADVNLLTVGTTSSQTIDGSTTQVWSTQYDSMTVVSDGANWQTQ